MKLNLSERLFALRYLDAFKGRVSLLSLVITDVPKLSISEDEWVKADRKITELEGGDRQWAWNDDKGGTKDIDMNAEVKAWLKEEVERHEKADGFSIKDKAVISLLAKLQ